MMMRQVQWATRWGRNRGKGHLIEGNGETWRGKRIMRIGG